MNAFEDQLRDRISNDDRSVNENLRKLGDAATGTYSRYYAEETASLEKIRQIKRICRYLDLPIPEKIPEIPNINDQIEYILQYSGAVKRHVELNDTWWKDGDGPLLAQIKGTEDVIALLPGKTRGYYFTDRESGHDVRVTAQNKDLFEQEAYCFYKPLPGCAMTGRDFILFLLRQLDPIDILLMVSSALFITVFGMLTPFATEFAFSDMISSGDKDLLIPLGILLIAAAVGTWLMRTAKMSVSARIKTRLDVVSQNAVFSRLIHLPASFFGDKSSGGLAKKVMALNMVPSILTDVLFEVFLTVFISIIYIFQILTIAKPLVLPVAVIYITELILFTVTVNQERKYVSAMLEGDEKNNGLVFELLSGIQKIKTSGSENRAFARWMETYAKKVKPAYAVYFPASIRTPLMTAVHMAGLLWIYITAYQNNVSIAQFSAFSSAFGLVMAGITALGNSGTSLAMINPLLISGEPILKEIPEKSTGKQTIHTLNGRIDVNQVVFRYEKDAPAVINGLSLHIEPGEYVAIVGRSGCGKSTLLRLLLGFEEPEQGAIYYDNNDLGSLDKQSLRRNIGTVLQDGKLFAGDIFSNITISAPWMTMTDAWDAAEKAGIAEEIRRMPMGMYTLITEGEGGISGGQKQRILVARAICGKPNIIMLDEATSALDNLTQKVVTDSMNEMNCTRIVIAHRLSTIKACDRIIVLDKGVIAEDGTYEELLAKNGLFTELVKRQMVEEE